MDAMAPEACPDGAGCELSAIVGLRLGGSCRRVHRQQPERAPPDLEVLPARIAGDPSTRGGGNLLPQAARRLLPDCVRAGSLQAHRYGGAAVFEDRTSAARRRRWPRIRK